tara:strand:- start:3275 stop:3568 length:294 start_codon:yes stop_codon:yes gene_type:complete
MKTNKLIAEFMGGQRVLPDKDVYNMPTHNNLCYGVDELHYHTSWDWLMPVVDKVHEKVKGNLYPYYKLVTAIQDRLSERNKEATYQAVVEFIKQHNK